MPDNHRIPLGLANFKLIPVTLRPFGRDIISIEEAERQGLEQQVTMPASAPNPELPRATEPEVCGLAALMLIARREQLLIDSAELPLCMGSRSARERRNDRCLSSVAGVS